MARKPKHILNDSSEHFHIQLSVSSELYAGIHRSARRQWQATLDTLIVQLETYEEYLISNLEAEAEAVPPVTPETSPVLEAIAQTETSDPETPPSKTRTKRK